MGTWSAICNSINDGDLGIRKTAKNNFSPLTKTMQRCLSNEEILSTEILKAKYCPNKSPLEANFRKGNSWFWKGFMEEINFINEKVGWVIGNGNKISI